ncbi:MAG: hypothetical protein FWH32_04775 [Clostridiales bacterium]|nr:hypothetical protein [Clostridiales bacterium]
MKTNLDIRFVLTILGLVSGIIGGTMLVGLVCSLIFGELDMGWIFLWLFVVFAAVGFFVVRFSRRGLRTKTVKIREGLLAVTLCWVFAAVFCAFPYLLSGSHHTFIDAFFEATACITTTSSTLVENLAELPRSLLFWRQLTIWLGGVGIIIFAITIIPMLGYGAANLANAETTVQTVEKIRSRMTDTARTIFLLFLGLTLVEMALLALGGMGIFDAIVLSFSSVGTGGFANYRAGAVLGNSLYVDTIVAVFCIIASMSFVSYRHLLKRRPREFFREVEIRAYLIMLAAVCGLVFIILLAFGTYGTAGEAARYGIMQSISFATTAGYPGTNVDLWPQATQWLLIGVMIVGGCSGSTTGGLKVARMLVAISLIRRNIYKRLHPNAVVAVKIGDNAVPSDRVSSIATLMIVYAFIVALSAFVLSFDTTDAGTTLGTVIAMLSNTGLVIGPGLGVGEAFTMFSQFSRVYMSLLMVAGRLELLTLVLLFSPAFWRPYR